MKPVNEYCLIGASTDKGQVRKANEDSYGQFDSPNGYVFVVCDGMGGHVGGQIASQTAVRAIRDFLTVNTFENPRDAITQSVCAANQAILNVARERPELSGMGSTCVMVIVKGGIAYWGHVGDSRIYYVSDHRIRQITKDQSFVQQLVDEGRLKPEEAEHHPQKNVITNALGFEGMTPPVLAAEPVAPEAGACFVLCSDGLSGMVADKDIEHIVSKHDKPIQQRADALVAQANANGGKDNITVVLVEFTLSYNDLMGSIPREKSKKSKLIWGVGIALAVILLCIGGWLWFGPSASSSDQDATETKSDSIPSNNQVEPQNESSPNEELRIQQQETTPLPGIHQPQTNPSQPSATPSDQSDDRSLKSGKKGKSEISKETPKGEKALGDEKGAGTDSKDESEEKGAETSSDSQAGEAAGAADAAADGEKSEEHQVPEKNPIENKPTEETAPQGGSDTPKDAVFTYFKGNVFDMV